MSTSTMRPSRALLWIWLTVAIGLGVLLSANAHLVFVAFTSQPACVQHSKAPGIADTYRAAKSAC